MRWWRRRPPDPAPHEAQQKAQEQLDRARADAPRVNETARAAYQMAKYADWFAQDIMRALGRHR